MQAALPVLVACGGMSWCTAFNAASLDAAPYVHGWGWASLSRKVNPVELVSVPP
jgi:hypothetical protein